MDLLRKIAAGKLDPVYVLYGAEPGATRAVVQALRKVVIPSDEATAQAMAAFNHERFDGGDLANAGPVLSACAQVPMMSRWRLVELTNPEDIGKGPEADSTTAAAIDALAGYIKAPSPSTVLVITSTGIDAAEAYINLRYDAQRHGVAMPRETPRTVQTFDSYTDEDERDNA